MREKALIAPDTDPSLSDLSDLQYSLLEVIGSSRHYGIFRTNITKKFLKIDARSTFHHVKILEKAGLIIVKVTGWEGDYLEVMVCFCEMVNRH